MTDLSIVRTGWGTALVVAPRAVSGLLHAGAPPSWLVRVLGARHLLQVVVLAARPTPRARTLGWAVDALHSLSALTLALARPRWRRLAAADCVIAGLFALAGAGHPRRTQSYGGVR